MQQEPRQQQQQQQQQRQRQRQRQRDADLVTAQLAWNEQSTALYSNYPLDRAPEARADAARVDEWLHSPEARTLLLCGSRVLVRRSTSTTNPESDGESDGDSGGSGGSGGSDGSGPQLQPVWVSPAAPLAAAADAAIPALFLGLQPGTGAPHFAVSLPRSGPAADAAAAAHGGEWLPARSAGPELAPAQAALVAVASGLAAWHVDAAHCGASGAPTVSVGGGFARKVLQATSAGEGSSQGSNTRRERKLYPRTDPAVITLVTTAGDWALLGAHSTTACTCLHVACASCITQRNIFQPACKMHAGLCRVAALHFMSHARHAVIIHHMQAARLTGQMAVTLH